MSGNVLRIASLAALGLASGAQPAGADATTIKGVFKAVVTVVSPVSMPLQTPIQVKVSASLTGQGGGQSATGVLVVKKTANSQAVTINIPYQWTLPPAGVAVRFSVAVTPTLTYPASNYASVSTAIPLPANNATTTVAVSTRL
ncbi:MAG TPA: hypothetical protein PKA55_15115 [Rhodoblastus sp.]|nr:hypothetical protein [Rhodoblastus sp.]